MRTLLSVWPTSGSVNAKSLECSASGVSSAVTRVLSALSGGVLLPTLMVTVALEVPPWPSETV